MASYYLHVSQVPAFSFVLCFLFVFNMSSIPAALTWWLTRLVSSIQSGSEGHIQEGWRMQFHGQHEVSAWCENQTIGWEFYLLRPL